MDGGALVAVGLYLNHKEEDIQSNSFVLKILPFQGASSQSF
jgi:hypothetical protein